MAVMISLLVLGATVAAATLSPCYQERGHLYDEECARIGLPCQGPDADAYRSYWTGSHSDASLNCDDKADPEPGHMWMNNTCGARRRSLTAEGRKRAALFARFIINNFQNAAARVLLTDDERDQTARMSHFAVHITLTDILNRFYVNRDQVEEVLCEMVFATIAYADSKKVTSCLQSRRHFLMKACSDLHARCGHNGTQDYGKDEPVFRRVLGRHLIERAEDQCPPESTGIEEDVYHCKNVDKALTHEAAVRVRLAAEFVLALRPVVAAAALLTDEEHAKYKEVDARSGAKLLERAFTRAVTKSNGNPVRALCPLVHGVLNAGNVA